MINLGIDTLSDDQIIELARAISGELAKRQPAVLDAAQAAIRDEIAKARNSQDRQWATKKWLATMARDYLGSGISLTVWRSDDGKITRVYLDAPGTDRKGREAIKWCYHVTGDDKHPPKTVTVSEGRRVTATADHGMIAIIARHAVAAYSRVRIDCDQAAATDYAIPAMPADYAERAAREAARDAFLKDVRNRHFGPVEAAEQAACAEHKAPYVDASLLPADIYAQLKASRDAANAAYRAEIAAHDGDAR